MLSGAPFMRVKDVPVTPRRGWFARGAGAVKHLLTAKDGETYTPARVYWCLAALTQIGLSIWHTAILGQAFSSTDFGTGMGLVLTAGGLGVWITRKSEPDE